MPSGRGLKIDQSNALLQRARERALDLIEYIGRSPTPYHAVAETARRLDAARFTALDETAEWKLRPGDRHYVVRGASSIIAFQVGKRPPARGGFRMIGAHTDSPNLKLKPRASYTRHGFRQLGVEVYGGVLLHTWLDRDLSIAGRVALRGKDGGVEMRLVDFERPLCRVASLAIHLNRDVNRDGLKLNTQTHLPPLLALDPDNKKGDETDALRALIAERLEVAADSIIDHDLSLYDVQKGALSGPGEELIYVARLDNLASCHAALGALVAVGEEPGEATRLIALHDHEEVGSKSAQGAAGPFLESVLVRILEAAEKSEPQGLARAMAASFHVSSDMAHAVHPNFADKHEPQHMPLIGQGPVIKTNANQSYATDGESSAIFAALCQEAGFEPQSFVARTDLGCGSTIGPITATRLGVKTVDCGNPMLSMHSIREMAGTIDGELLHRVLTLYLGSA